MIHLQQYLLMMDIRKSFDRSGEKKLIIIIMIIIIIMERRKQRDTMKVVWNVSA